VKSIAVSCKGKIQNIRIPNSKDVYGLHRGSVAVFCLILANSCYATGPRDSVLTFGPNSTIRPNLGKVAS
jgi:hypothetical protein